MARDARGGWRITANSPVVLTFVAACFAATLAGHRPIELEVPHARA